MDATVKELILETPPRNAQPLVDHAVRIQLIEAAAVHFSQYGYAKTTLADLAKAVGYSKSYIYRFFDSKREIGEAICDRTLKSILEKLVEVVKSDKCPFERLREVISTIALEGVDLFFNNRKLHDIAAASCDENWASSENYRHAVADLIRTLLLEGRQAGDFERKTPLDEVVRSILLAISPFMDPRALQHNLDRVPDGVKEISNLILRSLAP